jgi:hypothetical protein
LEIFIENFVKNISEDLDDRCSVNLIFLVGNVKRGDVAFFASLKDLFQNLIHERGLSKCSLCPPFYGVYDYGTRLSEFIHQSVGCNFVSIYDYLVIGDLSEDFNLNRVCQQVYFYGKKKAFNILFQRFYGVSNTKDFPGQIYSDDSSWIRSYGRRIITYLFNRFILRVAGYTPVSDATLSYRAYLTEMFNDVTKREFLIETLKGKSPFEAQLILLTWMRGFDFPVVEVLFSYKQSKSTLKLKHVFAVLKLIFEMLYSLSFKGNWKNLVFKRV